MAKDVRQFRASMKDMERDINDSQKEMKKVPDMIKEQQ